MLFEIPDHKVVTLLQALNLARAAVDSLGIDLQGQVNMQRQNPVPPPSPLQGDPPSIP
jgi:hypothetical protein